MSFAEIDIVIVINIENVIGMALIHFIGITDFEFIWASLQCNFLQLKEMSLNLKFDYSITSSLFMWVHPDQGAVTTKEYSFIGLFDY